MKTFRVLEVTVTTYAYDVKAKSEKQAVQIMDTGTDVYDKHVIRRPFYDKEISRDWQCEGEID